MSPALGLVPATPGHGWVGSWAPGIGDPTVVGWFTVFAYLLVAWRCYRIARRLSAARANRRELRVWAALALAFLLLGINKQLDLQSALTEAGRLIAYRQGWYAERRHVQREFIAVVGLLGAAAIALGVWLARRTSRAARLAISGAIVVVTFVVIRAASFHHMDIFIHSHWLGMKVNWLLELPGIIVVLIATERANRIAVRAPKGPAPSPKGRA